MIKTRAGITIVATLKEGWRGKFKAPGELILIHPEHHPRRVDLATIREGDLLPRDTDEALGFSPTIGGH